MCNFHTLVRERLVCSFLGVSSEPCKVLFPGLLSVYKGSGTLCVCIHISVDN